MLADTLAFEGTFSLPSRKMRIGRREVKLTNLGKVFFPQLGLTKGDLIEYYLDLAPYLLIRQSDGRCR